MKRAAKLALDGIEAVLLRLREIPGLREKKRGIFYRASRPFLQCHEDSAGMFADLKDIDGFHKRPIGTAAELECFFKDVESLLSSHE